jgi:hypothetical protein
MENIKA